jgi:hypothetical protein
MTNVVPGAAQRSGSTSRVRPFSGMPHRLGGQQPVAQTPSQEFQLPSCVLCDGADVYPYLQWFASRYGSSPLGPVAREDWDKSAWVFRQARHDRPLRIHAFRSQDWQGQFASLDCTALEARSHTYDIGSVTGLDFEVLAALVEQREMPRLLREAVMLIEAQGLDEIAFLCDGGTHRSLGCCMLLAALVYKLASVCPHTSRTIEAARRRLRVA